MKYYTRRRLKALVILGVITVAFLVFFDGFRVTLRNPHVLSGWFFLAVMTFLALFNVRKKFPVPPLGPSRLWLQFHIYGGAFTLVPYFFHAGFEVPTGVLEKSLALLYFGVMISGVVGLIMTRVFPRRLTANGEEAVFERLPEHRRRIKEEVDRLAEQSIVDTQSTTISKFYTKRLRSYFDGPRHMFNHIFEVAPPLNRMIGEIEDQYRYLNEDEQKILAKIADYVRQKNRLDYQYALQFALKTWLFLHIPLTSGLFVLIIVHVWLTHAFSGRAL